MKCKFRVLLSVLFIMNVSAMDNSKSNKASEGLFKLMCQAYNRANNSTLNALLGLPEQPFDHSEKALIAQVQSFIDQGADPNFSLFFKVPMPGNVGMQLPTSVWLAQKLNYREVVNLFSDYTKKRVE